MVPRAKPAFDQETFDRLLRTGLPERSAGLLEAAFSFRQGSNVIDAEIAVLEAQRDKLTHGIAGSLQAVEDEELPYVGAYLASREYDELSDPDALKSLRDSFVAPVGDRPTD